MSGIRNKETFAHEVEGFSGKLRDYLDFLKSRYDNKDMAILEEEASSFFDGLLDNSLEEVEVVMMFLMNYLVLKSMIYQERFENSTDPMEYDLNLRLLDTYTYALYGHPSLDEGLFVFCEQNSRVSKPENVERWGAISESIKARLPLEKQIEIEIERRNRERAFSPSSYARWRREGRLPDQIDYDMCHYFR